VQYQVAFIWVLATISTIHPKDAIIHAKTICPSSTQNHLFHNIK